MSEAATTSSLLDRTLRSVRRAWQRTYSTPPGESIRADLGVPEIETLRTRIRDCLEGRGGEVSARARAAELGHTYLALSAKGRRRFLQLLARDFDIDQNAVSALATERSEALEAADEKALEDANERLRDALIAPRSRLLSQFTALESGVKFLVDLRAELRTDLRAHPELRGLDRDLLRLLAAWFDVGFLDLERITWSTPAALLEKLIEYEAVHEIRSWEDLKNRLADDRRCYAFFHPRMPDEPLIFVEVALVNGIADDVQRLLDEQAPVDDPDSADTAIFYSISNCQIGLAGVSFGNFLIKRVAEALAEEFPNLKQFATLSPIPGLMAWLDQEIELGHSLLVDTERKQLAEACAAETGVKTEVSDGAFLELIRNPGLLDGGSCAAAVEGPLMRLTARYLIMEKRGRQALDRVAHFHLSNGARVERINWGADCSARGLAQSAGTMVNYLYNLGDIEKNHEAYSGEGVVAASPAVKKLAKAART